MLNRVRDGTFSLVVIIALFSAVWSLLIFQISAEKQYQADSAKYYSERVGDGTAGEDCTAELEYASIKECVERQAKAARETKNAEYDLAAQQEMAYWTPWALLGSVVTAFISLIGVVYVRDTLLETRRLGEAQTRAYLSVADFKSKIVGEENACISVEVTFKNTGQTPARNVRTYLAWASDPPPFKDELHLTTIVNPEGRGSIAAGMPFFGGIRTDRFKSDPDTSLTAGQIVDVLRGKSKFWLYGLLEYDDVFGRHRRTRFRYEMNVEHPDNVGFSPCLTGNEED